MQIQIDNLSKRFGHDWVIKGLSHSIQSGDRVAVRGANGSGKSTLLKLLSGFLSMTEGTIQYHLDEQPIHRNDVNTYLSYAAPYITFQPDFTPSEVFLHLSEHRQFTSTHVNEFLDKAELKSQKNKHLREFSDGMRQRLSLAIAIDCKSEVLLLDEPTSYLDQYYIDWYFDLIVEELGHRTLILASNAENDFKLCSSFIDSSSFSS